MYFQTFFQKKSNGTNSSRFLICCLTLLLITCQKDMSSGDGNDLNANPNTIASSESVAPDRDPIILGENIKSPYSLEAMEESLNNLRKSNKYGHLAREYDITTTHHYVKFYPESEEHLDLLAYDNQLILYPYPLDREIVNGTSSVTFYFIANLPSISKILIA